MPYVVLEKCIACRHGDCVAVCPQGAFRQGPNFVVIDPAVCANCGLCEIACPIGAIKADWALAENEQVFKSLNAELSGQWPIAFDVQPLETAQSHRDLPGKIDLLQRS
jgi:ferredoxin